jgi:mannose-1-phosphate guanylyltransferase
VEELELDFGLILKIIKQNNLLILVIGLYLSKTLERTKASIYDAPIISTNKKYLKQVKQHLKKNKINKYKIVLEPAKRNTAPAILSTCFN